MGFRGNGNPLKPLRSGLPVQAPRRFARHSASLHSIASPAFSSPCTFGNLSNSLFDFWLMISNTHIRVNLVWVAVYNLPRHADICL